MDYLNDAPEAEHDEAVQRAQVGFVSLVPRLVIPVCARESRLARRRAPVRLPISDPFIVDVAQELVPLKVLVDPFRVAEVLRRHNVSLRPGRVDPFADEGEVHEPTRREGRRAGRARREGRDAELYAAHGKRALILLFLARRGSQSKPAHMLRAERDQVAHCDASEPRAIAPLDDGAEELTALREPDRVELARRVLVLVGQLGQTGELLADGLDLIVGEAKEGGAPVHRSDGSAMKDPRFERRQGTALVARPILRQLYDMHKDPFEALAFLQVSLEGLQTVIVEPIAEAVPDLGVRTS